MQQFIVVSRPVRRADDYWEVTCRLIDNNYSSRIDLDDYEVGDTTRFQSNAIENFIMQILSVALLGD